MTEKKTSITTYIIILFVVGIFSALIVGFGQDLSNNDNANLSNASKIYITEMNGGSKNLGWNDSVYDIMLDEASKLGGNDNKNEFSLDFSFGDKAGSKIERIVYVVMNIPEFFFMDVFRLTGLQWLVDLLDWLLNIFIFITVVRYIRKG